MLKIYAVEGTSIMIFSGWLVLHFHVLKAMSQCTICKTAKLPFRGERFISGGSVKASFCRVRSHHGSSIMNY